LFSDRIKLYRLSTAEVDSVGEGSNPSHATYILVRVEKANRLYGIHDPVLKELRPSLTTIF